MQDSWHFILRWQSVDERSLTGLQVDISTLVCDGRTRCVTERGHRGWLGGWCTDCAGVGNNHKNNSGLSCALQLPAESLTLSALPFSPPAARHCHVRQTSPYRPPGPTSSQPLAVIVVKGALTFIGSTCTLPLLSLPSPQPTPSHSPPRLSLYFSACIAFL